MGLVLVNLDQSAIDQDVEQLWVEAGTPNTIGRQNYTLAIGDRIMVSSESLAVHESLLAVCIPKGVHIVVVHTNGQTKIAETAQPLLVTGPVITTLSNGTLI